MNREIHEQLKNVRDRALAPYSHFKVGAVLLTPTGKMFTGHNIESSSYGLTICAERVALFKALSEGERRFDSLYIVSDNNEFCPPCGACRQVLMDYAPEIKIVLTNDRSEEKLYTLSELLPDPFTPDRLNKQKLI